MCIPLGIVLTVILKDTNAKMDDVGVGKTVCKMHKDVQMCTLPIYWEQ